MAVGVATARVSRTAASEHQRVVIGSLDAAACGTTAAAADRDAAYVTTASPSGLMAVVVSPSGGLVDLGLAPLPGFPADAVLAGSRVYTVNLTAGVSAVDVTTCRQPLRPRGRRMP